MNTFEKDSVRKMRENGKSYSQIAAALSISENTVKSFCRRMGIISLVEKPVCPVCGKILMPSKQGQRRRFCSDTCRFVWNYGHRVLDAHNAIACRCAHCQREFFSPFRPSQILLSRLLHCRPLREGGFEPCCQTELSLTAAILSAWPFPTICYGVG